MVVMPIVIITLWIGICIVVSIAILRIVVVIGVVALGGLGIDLPVTII